MLLGGAIAALTIVFNLLLPHRMRLIGVALLVVPQIWIPGLPEAELATIAVVWTLSTCVAGITARDRTHANSSLVVIGAVFVAATAVSLTWALPGGINNGMSAVVRGVVFLLWLREMIVVAKDDPKLLNTIMIWLIPGVSAQALLAILFRVSPDIEERFLRSNLAAVFVGPQAEGLYGAMRNNVLYPFKSGGLYVNGNVASLFGAVAALLLILAARRSANRWLYVFAALSAAGAIFTGSKTALVLAPVCVLAIIFLPHALKAWVALVGLWITLLVPVAISVGIELLQQNAPAFYSAAVQSVAGRDPLWRGAAQLFTESPLLGVGFGGWSEQMQRFTHQPELPPHNLIVAAWAYSGIVAALVAIVFLVAAMNFAVRVAAAQPTTRDRRNAVLALCAIAWVFLHGMADNTTIYGEQRTMILVALAFGYLYAMRPDPQISADAVGTDADRARRSPAAISS